jgi:endonuclease YncB( thermonuclease family)
MLERIKAMIWKKPTGFDWHQYVQTTIKLRREQRRQRVIDAGQAAVDQAQAAAAKVASGSLAAGAAAKDGAIAAASSAGHLAAASLQQTPALMARVFGPALRWTARAVRPISGRLIEPAVAGPLAIAGAIAGASGVLRWLQTGGGHDAWMPLGVGAALLGATLPALAKSVGFNPGRTFRYRSPAVPTPRFGRRSGLALGVATAVVAALGYVALRLGPSVPALSALSTTATIPTLTTKPIIEARGAQALSGDTLRIDGRTVRLVGVEAPHVGQRCARGSSKNWRCGEAAQAAVERLTRSKSVRCVVASTEPSGRNLATCTIDGRDIAADLLKDGHVFSTSGYFGAYASLESDAKRSKAGVWAGDAERPADFRSRLWDTAKATAPDGCPIKGHVAQSGKTYILPWAREYARTTLRPTRGDRWFCSEREASAAGFKLAERD